MSYNIELNIFDCHFHREGSFQLGQSALKGCETTTSKSRQRRTIRADTAERAQCPKQKNKKCPRLFLEMNPKFCRRVLS